MPHHEESPEKPGNPPPFLDTPAPPSFCITPPPPPFLATIFRPLISINFKKVEAPWVRTMYTVEIVWEFLGRLTKTDQADVIDWMFFLPSNLMKEITTSTKAFSANT